MYKLRKMYTFTFLRQFLQFSSVLLTKNVKGFDIFLAVPGKFDGKSIKYFGFAFFVFSCDEKCKNTFAS